MKDESPEKLIVDALLQRFLPLARRRIETAQAHDLQCFRPSDPAYEQVLDSLAMVARHTPIPLLEALLRWRDSESPKGPHDAATFQKKLAIECIFCSACLRFVECFPQDGLTEKLWSGLENFVFDWLINAERVISQTEYPSLVDLRGLLLDLVAQLLGALSRVRFSSVTDRLFMELSTRRIDIIVARIETLSIIHGARYLQLGVKTEVGLSGSASFLTNASPLNRSPNKRKSELQHALCNMLSNILAPLADGGKGKWPPSVAGLALSFWYEAVAQLRLQLNYWIEKDSKHIAAGYPLVTLLLCLGDPIVFLTNFGPHMDQLYRLLKDKSHRSMALDCLHRILRFYLNIYGDSQPTNRVWDYLDSVNSQLLTLLKKGLLTQDIQNDKLVDFGVTIAEHNIEFAIKHMVLGLLKKDGSCEAKIIGLRALLAIVMPPTSKNTGLEVLHVHKIGHFIPLVKSAIDIIVRSCHKIYSQALLTSSKANIDAMTKEKSQAYLFRSVLKCLPCLLEEVTGDKITEIIPQHGMSIDPGVREEAVQALNRIVRYLPHQRFAVMKGMANSILRVPDEFPLLIQTSLGRLLDLMSFWRSCIYEDMAEFDAPGVKRSHSTEELKSSSFRRTDEAVEFPGLAIETVGILFLTSIDNQIRHMSLELLRSVRALRNDVHELLMYERPDRLLKNEAGPIHIIDVLEEHGDDIVQNCYWYSGCPFDMRRESDSVPVDVTPYTILFESSDKNRWARCLSELAKYAAELCPGSVKEAKKEIVQRLAHITPIEMGGKAHMPHQLQDTDNMLDQWLMYSMFACSCRTDIREIGVSAETKQLLQLTFAYLRSGSEAQMHAASMALGQSNLQICEAMFTELASLNNDISQETEGKAKWKIQKSRREEFRVNISNIYRSVSENIWPGMLRQRPGLRRYFSKFIDDTTKQILAASAENFQDTQLLRYALASGLRSLAPEFVDSISEKFDIKTRKMLFDLLLPWSDDSGSMWSHDGINDYRLEVERYKSLHHHTRSKESMDKTSFDKEICENIEAIQWASVNAMASLLYGPCFDDNAKKMTGRVISWINSLFIEPASRAPYGYSPADARAPSYQKYAGDGARGVTGRDKHIGGHLRVSIAKLALKNLLLTNLDLFPACIDQCYYSDPSIADGYFSVLAEVYMREEIPECQIQRLLSLILYKVVDPSWKIRDGALQMLETLSIREWVTDDIECSRSYQASVVGNLPDSYQQFQYKLSCRLAKDHPELSQLLCEEIMQRQLDAVDIIAQHQVLTCMAPWIKNLYFWKLKDSGWSERLLKSLYYVTWRHGDQFPDEIGKLWSTIASKPRNISTVLDFLIAKGIEDFDSHASAEINGAFATYFSVAKRVSLYLARICPQRTIDHLVYQLAQWMLEDNPEPLRPTVNSDPVLEFSQGPTVPHTVPITESQRPMSPMLVRGSLDGTQKNVNGNMSWHNSAIGGRIISATSGLPELNVAHVSTGRSSHLLPSLTNISGSLRRVRSSRSTMRSQHLSRESTEYLVETPTSVEDNMHGVSARELQAALQGHEQRSLTRADIALILLVEIAYENDEDFREHLPLLFHVIFVSMDSSEDIVLEHCQHLLVNLLYSLAGRHLELYEIENSEAENKQQVASLIEYVKSKKGSLMWENEDPTLLRVELPSAALLSALVQSMVDAIFFQGDLRETWGAEALKWATECTSRHLACRSHQIYRALRPCVTNDACVSLLRCLHRCLGNPVPPVLGFMMEIFRTLQVMVERMEPEKMILYPQLFWGCVALMHTDYVHVYCQVLNLFSRVIDHFSFHDGTTENVLLSSMPRDELNSAFAYGSDIYRMELKSSRELAPPNEKMPLFEGVQPLILKGLMSTVSHGVSVKVLSQITVPSCDSIFGEGETRLLMHIIGLLPWLCLQVSQDSVLGPSSPIEKQYQKASSVATNIAVWCQAKGLDELATVFEVYSRGEIKSVATLLVCVSPLLCNEWFPEHSTLAFGHLLQLLERGLLEYQRVILFILKALLQHTQMDGDQSPQMYVTVSHLVESSLCWEALSVLEALLQSRDSSPETYLLEHGSFGTSFGGTEDKSLISQSSFKSQNGSQQFGMQLGFDTVSGSTGRLSNLTDYGPPQWDVCLHNTRMILGRILDQCSLGRRRDYRRLVPFVTTVGQP